MRVSSAIGAVALLLTLSCGNENGAEPGGEGGGVAPGGEWSSVIRSVECTPPENRPLCVQGSFSVSRDGSFAFSDSGGPSRGSISEPDLRNLSAEALDVVRGDIEGELECDAEIVLIPELQSIEASVVRPGGDSVAFFRVNRADGLCWRGAQVEAEELESELQGLVRKYIVEGDAL